MILYRGLSAWLQVLVPCVFLLEGSAQAGSSEDNAREADALSVSGSAGLYGKFNSNLDLVDEKKTGQDQKDAFITEPTANLRLEQTWGPKWWLDLSYTGHANFHTEHRSEDWFFNRTHLSLTRRSGAHALNLSSEVRYLAVPDDDDFDFLRHTGILSYERTLSPLWQVQVGLENIRTRYPQSRWLDYSVNGGFVEVRTTWSFKLTTYYSVDLQWYEGTANTDEADPSQILEDGSRRTVRAGFDWLMSNRHVFSGTLMQQRDNSEFDPRRIGEVEGHEDSQDIDAEFDLLKHKGTLLYTYGFNDRTSISLYEELIHKSWEDEDDGGIIIPKRTDWLFLSSSFLKFKWKPNLNIKTRYLFRMNASTSDVEDYFDHIIFVGPEYIF